jgi:hypothetical protein
VIAADALSGAAELIDGDVLARGTPRLAHAAETLVLAAQALEFARHKDVVAGAALALGALPARAALAPGTTGLASAPATFFLFPAIHGRRQSGSRGEKSASQHAQRRAAAEHLTGPVIETL